MNPSLVRTMGYPEPELLALSVLEITHPDDREPSRRALSQLAEGRDVVGFVSRIVRPDGSVRWLEWNTHTMPERGVVYGAARDTTELRRLADAQAALRRVAMRVASGPEPEELFAAVAREVGEALGVDATHLGRYDADGTVVSVAQWGAHATVELGARFPLAGDSVSARVLRTGRPARMESYEGATGPIAETVRQLGIRYSIAVPISVAGRTWGVMIASTRGGDPFPAEVESQLHDFTELLATAIANASAHERLLALADEQAALRRVATLVARQTPQAELFAAIAEEIGRLLGVDSIVMLRYEDGVAVAVAGWGRLEPVLPSGTRLPLGGRNIASLVFRSGRPARLDDYRTATGAVAAQMAAGGVRSAVGTPISVGGRMWGAMIAASTHEGAMPRGTESRIGQFTELMATAIANAEARAEAARLAGEQAALRRVATLVAQGASARAVFDAVTAEVSELLGAEAVTLARYEGDALVVLATRATRTHLEVGQVVPMQETDVTALVRRTGRPARRDGPPDGESHIEGILRSTGICSRVVAPVVVEGRTWGALAASWIEGSPPPEDTEQRMAGFTQLLDTAIANADSRDQLTASRARVLAAADDARRRVVRDLHDGAQQRLVHSIVTLKLARQALAEQQPNADELVDEALGYTEGAMADLRELSHGILPVGLIRGGLSAAVDALVSRVELPVDVDVSAGRLPRDVEASAYFVVAEALTNVVKHAGATRAKVRVAVEQDVLHVEVGDDGIGGADPAGLGLVGIADRVDALGGALTVESGDRAGTTLMARLPLST